MSGWLILILSVGELCIAFAYLMTLPWLSGLAFLGSLVLLRWACET